MSDEEYCNTKETGNLLFKELFDQDYKNNQEDTK